MKIGPLSFSPSNGRPVIGRPLEQPSFNSLLGEGVDASSIRDRAMSFVETGLFGRRDSISESSSRGGGAGALPQERNTNDAPHVTQSPFSRLGPSGGVRFDRGEAVAQSVVETVSTATDDKNVIIGRAGRAAIQQVVPILDDLADVIPLSVLQARTIEPKSDVRRRISLQLADNNGTIEVIVVLPKEGVSDHEIKRRLSSVIEEFGLRASRLRIYAQPDSYTKPVKGAYHGA